MPKPTSTLPKNLQNADFVDHEEIKKSIGNFFTQIKAEKNSSPIWLKAYKLSAVLLMIRMSGDQVLFDVVLPEMQKEMKEFAAVPKLAPFNAWMYGRILLAAYSVDKKNVVADALANLQKLLKDPECTATNDDAFSAACTVWAREYLASYYAAIASDQYQSTLQKTIDETYDFAKKHPKNTSDTIWSWLMIFQAAADAGDEKSCDLALAQVKLIAKKDTITEALRVGLPRDAKSSEYPLWGQSAVCMGAAAMSHKPKYKALHLNARTAYTEAQSDLVAEIKVEQSKTGSEGYVEKMQLEQMLGRLTKELAVERYCARQEQLEALAAERRRIRQQQTSMALCVGAITAIGLLAYKYCTGTTPTPTPSSSVKVIRPS